MKLLVSFVQPPTYTHTHSILATRTGNTVLFYHEGGVDVGDVDSKATKVDVDIEETLTTEQATSLLAQVAKEKQK